MPWHATFHSQRPLVEVGFSGRISPAELFAAVRQILILARRHASERVLVDCTQLGGGDSVFELYTIAHALTLSNLPGTLRQAIVCSATAAQARAAHSWNAAWESPDRMVRLFDDHARALAWLFEATSPGTLPARQSPHTDCAA